MTNKNDLNSLWLDPPAIYRPAPFWSWNAKLDPERLCRQIESMDAGGMGGFFMHSRYGLKTEYLGDEWFECISACIEKARQIGMKAYLYDEDRWPSGMAGGDLTRKDKQYRMRYLVAGDPEELKSRLDSPRDRLGLFAVELDKDGLLKSYESVEEDSFKKDAGNILALDVHTQEPHPWENDGTYIDTMSRKAVAEFLRVTHEEYYKRYGSDFGELIPAIFTDEPNYGLARQLWFEEPIKDKYRIHWTPDLPEEFERRRGYSVIPYLPEIVFPRDENKFSEVTYDYYRTITELFVENFTAQIGDWCSVHDIALTGHVLFEETVRTQIGAVGSAMSHYEHMQWPGIDILTDQTKELATAKQCSSVADQLGKERVLTELYGCTGWDWPLEGHKFIADWQLAMGINFLCPHLSHYSLAGGAKRDYPASIIDHCAWWKYYRTVNDYLARMSLMLTQGRAVRDVLVIHPVESAWGVFNYFQDKYACYHETPESDGPIHYDMDSIIFALTGHHYDWDFADESLLAKYGKA
ncbi:MAG: glycosyl hydrolase, partial [Planctomycetota bacterium]